MDKLEEYLDQLCRSIGGPVEMRQHVRQELREHLLDAVAQHQAAGLSEAAAVDRAIVEFGRPDEVRTDLEAAHGRRMTWILDKAMQWKEMTMKARWLWVSWAYLALLAIIMLEAMLISFNAIFIIPKFKKLLHDGMIDPEILDESGMMWMVDYLDMLSYTTGHHWVLWGLAPLALCALFEWRVKSDNKSFMGLAALGSAAIGLMIVIMLMVGSLVVPFCLAMPTLGMMTRPWAQERVAQIDASLSELEGAAAKRDWADMQEQAMKTSGGVRMLLIGPAVTALERGREAANPEGLRGHVSAMKVHSAAAEKAIQQHDRAAFDKALDEFRKSFAPVRDAAKRSAR